MRRPGPFFLLLVAAVAIAVANMAWAQETSDPSAKTGRSAAPAKAGNVKPAGTRQTATSQTPPRGARAWIPTAPLKGAAGLIELCDALRPEESVQFAGNEVAKAKARAEHRRRRGEASTGNYVVEVRPEGFTFKEYDLNDRRLVVDTDRGLGVAQGVELLVADRELVVDFELGAEAADALLKEHVAKKLVLRLIFRPAKSEMTQDACLRLGGQIAKMHVDVLAFDLVKSDGTTAARGETPEYHEAAMEATPVSAPQVSVRRPSGDRDVPDDVVTAAMQMGPTLLPCYRKALEARPGLRGTIVISFRIEADGRVESPRMEVSSVGDEAAVTCVIGRLARVRLGRVSPPMRISLPIDFKSRGESLERF